MLRARLPSLFRLPGYTQFEYRPRYYKESLLGRENSDKRIKIKNTAFNRNRNISGQIFKERTEIYKKAVVLSTIIRIILILLFVALCYYLAVSLGLLWQLS